MNDPESDRKQLEEATHDADASFTEQPVGSIVDPCPDKRIRVIFDDPFFGRCSRVIIRLVYSGGSRQTLCADPVGGIWVEKKRGQYADTSYERHGRTHERRVFLAPEDAPATSAAWQRLVNLGYVSRPEPLPTPDSACLGNAVGAFQADNRIGVTGELDAGTRAVIEREHADPRPWHGRHWGPEPEPGPFDESRKGSIS